MKGKGNEIYKKKYKYKILSYLTSRFNTSGYGPYYEKDIKVFRTQLTSTKISFNYIPTESHSSEHIQINTAILKTTIKYEPVKTMVIE